MKYDISTLLALSRNACIDSERLSTQAANNNILRLHKPGKNVLTERSNNRANQTTKVSSRRMAGHSASGSHFRHPSRQPHDPPQGGFAQSDSGFERFLQEHSSPRHQRVTAGGRIVPMEQLTPPPKMNLSTNRESTTSDVQSHDEHQPLLGTATQPICQDQTFNNFSTSSLYPTALTDYASFANVNGSLGPQFQIPGLFPNIPHGAIAPAMILPPQLSLHVGTQNISQSEKQSTDSTPVFQGVAVHGIGADQMTLLQNMNSKCPAAIIPFMAGQAGSSASRDSSEFSTGSNLNCLVSAHNPIPKGSDPFYDSIGPSTQRTPASQTSVVNHTRPPTNDSREVSPFQKLQNVTKEYNSLSVQLSRLDRHTAIHTWDMEPRQKRIAVEQRMSLVRELDVIRNYKEQLGVLCEQLKSTTSENPQESSAPHVSERPSRHSSSMSTHASAASIPWATLNHRTERLTKHSNSRPASQQPKPAQQRQNTGARHTSNNGHTNNGHRSASMSGSREPEPRSKAPFCDQSLNKMSSPGNRNEPRFANDGSYLAGTSERPDEMVTIPQPTPSGIRRLYRDIEEGIKSGSPIDGLLQELAATTTRLSSRRSENSGITFRLSSTEETFGSGDATGTASRTIRSMPCATDDDLQPARVVARRLWASENQPRSTAEMRPNESDHEDDDGGSWSSYDSTEDSWDTVRERDKQWIERQLLDDNQSTSNGPGAQVGSQQTDHDPFPEEPQSNSATSINKMSKPLESSIPLASHQYVRKNHGLVPRKSAALALPQNVNAHAYLHRFNST